MKPTLFAAALCVAAAPVMANEFAPAMEAYLQDTVQAWVTDPVLISAIKAQNERNKHLTQAEIDALDLAWRAEVGAADAPTITPVLQNAASDLLRAHVADSAGIVAELFIMDEHGLNVAASEVTSDMWQGDEEKFTRTFPMGAGAVHIGEVEFDESSQTYLGQISVSLVDPETGAVIGAMTVGLNAESLL